MSFGWVEFGGVDCGIRFVIGFCGFCGICSLVLLVGFCGGI